MANTNFNWLLPETLTLYRENQSYTISELDQESLMIYLNAPSSILYGCYGKEENQYIKTYLKAQISAGKGLYVLMPYKYSFKVVGPVQNWQGVYSKWEAESVSFLNVPVHLKPGFLSSYQGNPLLISNSKEALTYALKQRLGIAEQAKDIDKPSPKQSILSKAIIRLKSYIRKPYYIS